MTRCKNALGSRLRRENRRLREEREILANAEIARLRAAAAKEKQMVRRVEAGLNLELVGIRKRVDAAQARRLPDTCPGSRRVCCRDGRANGAGHPV